MHLFVQPWREERAIGAEVQVDHESGFAYEGPFPECSVPILSFSAMALVLPGSMALAIPAVNGREKLEPRFLTMLIQAKVPEATCDALGTAEVDSAALFGSLCPSREEMCVYFKRVLLIDPDARDTDFVIRARLLMVWESCKTRANVESTAAAERAVAQLPAQITVGDFETSRAAYESTLGFALEDHLCPSQPLLERLMAQAESTFKALKLTQVTSFAQQEALMPEHPGLRWDERAKNFQNHAKEFTIPMPKDCDELDTRFEVMGHAYAMLAMRYASNPKLTTAKTEVLTRYFKYLKGSKVWGFAVKRNGAPIATPTVEHVTDYDYAMREKQAKLINSGKHFQQALEDALADSDLRLLRFVTVFTCDAGSKACTDLSAPGISDLFPGQARGTKRNQPGHSANAAAASTASEPGSPSKSARKRQAKAKAKTLAQNHAQQQQQQQSRAQSQQQQQQQQQLKGTGKGAAAAKGAGKGARPALPPGCRDRDDQGRQICFAHNSGGCTRGDRCNFQHVSWKIPAVPGGAAAPPPGAGVGLV